MYILQVGWTSDFPSVKSPNHAIVIKQTEIASLELQSPDNASHGVQAYVCMAYVNIKYGFTRFFPQNLHRLAACIVHTQKKVSVLIKTHKRHISATDNKHHKWVWKTQNEVFQKQNRHIRCIFVFIFKHLFFLCRLFSNLHLGRPSFPFCPHTADPYMYKLITNSIWRNPPRNVPYNPSLIRGIYTKQLLHFRFCTTGKYIQIIPVLAIMVWDFLV